jgi:hypothetical protein
MEENVTSLERAKQIISQLQKKLDKNYQDKLEARSRVYDLAFRGKEEPTEKELKAQIVYLDTELKQAIERRDYWKEQYLKLKKDGKE